MACEEYSAGLPLKNIPSQACGPAFVTVVRWVKMLTCPRIRSWFEEKIQDYGLEPMVSSQGESNPQRTFSLAQRLASRLGPHCISSALIQWARLRQLSRYSLSSSFSL